MTKVRLVHWKAEEARERIERLEKAGFEVDFDELSPENYRQIRKQLPDALVIDLSRLPSHGREVALFFRGTKATCKIPVVFVDGKPEKIERVKQSVDQAVYTTWSRIKSGVKKAVANPPKGPLKPPSAMDGYSGTPLAKKLGITADNVVALVNEPEGFRKLLKDLPNGVTFKTSARGKRQMTIWFLSRLKDLEDRIDRMADAVESGNSLWIAWPKQSSGVKTDVTQTDVRKIGLASGLVDYKICAIDGTWSGLKFARRKTQ